MKISEHPYYGIWMGMNHRCHDPKSKSYPRYGGRGIEVHPDWRWKKKNEGGLEALLAFAEHIGPRPSPKYSVDRKDNSKGYEPGNVRWASPLEQRANTSKPVKPYVVPHRLRRFQN